MNHAGIPASGRPQNTTHRLAAGGQTVFHCHCHVIPRYAGDVPEPKGGARGVVPERRGY